MLRYFFIALKLSFRLPCSNLLPASNINHLPAKASIAFWYCFNSLYAEHILFHAIAFLGLYFKTILDALIEFSKSCWI